MAYDIVWSLKSYGPKWILSITPDPVRPPEVCVVSTDDSFYALEKLVDAVRELATSSDHIQGRLGDASIHLRHIRPEYIPLGELRREFSRILSELGFEAESENWATKIQTMDDAHARAIAHRIFELHRALEQTLK